MRYPMTPEVLDAIPEEAAALFRALELTLLKEISSRLTLSGKLNEVTISDMKALRALGLNTAEIRKAVLKTTKMGEKELDKAIAEAVRYNQTYYDEVITLADITVPDTLVDIATITAIRKQTLETYRNITQSMGFLVNAGRTLLPPARAYQWALDNALMQVRSGAISYNQAIANATRQLADSGLCTLMDETGQVGLVEYEAKPGKKPHYDKADVAVRRAVLTGVSQVCDKYTDQAAEYLDSPYVEISAHAGARDIPHPNPWSSHKDWQGKVYYQSKHGEKDPLGKYPDLVEKTGYGEVDGLLGANCRHVRYVWVEGVSERTYTDEQLRNIDPPPVEYEGKTYTHYEATQKQREIERTIRKWKRREAAATNPEDAGIAHGRVVMLKRKYKEFSREAELRTQQERMKVYIAKGA